MRRSSNALQQVLLDDTGSAWKQEASARLQAHRSRRHSGQPESAEPSAPATPGNGRHARIAQSVAERYAQAQSYSHYLEQAAAAAPPVKVRRAEPASPATFPAAALVAPAETAGILSPGSPHGVVPQEAATPRQTAETFLPLPVSIAVPEGLPAAAHGPAMHATNAVLPEHPPAEELAKQPLIEPQVSIPGNLIEFPRVLVAPRKARPRLAEGPLREPPAGTTETDEASQLRIFEVEPEHISREPLHGQAVEQPDWHSIELSTAPAVAYDLPAPAVTPEHRVAPRVSSAHASTAFDLPLQVAPLSRRLMAGLVDTCLIVLGFCTFAATAFAVASRPLSPEVAAVAAGAVFAMFYVAYYAMFCTWADATPGMRYARIALCTFRDGNPTRRETRWRLAAYLLSGATLGLGILWSLVDDDHLGWHDRMSRTYQRCY